MSCKTSVWDMKGIFYTSVIWAWLCGVLSRGTGEIRDPNVSHRCVIISSPDAWHSHEQSVFYAFWDQVQEDGNPTLRNTAVLSLIRSPLSSPSDDDPTRGLQHLPAPDECWSPSLTCLNKQHGWAMRFLICVRVMKKCSREGVQKSRAHGEITLCVCVCVCVCACASKTERHKCSSGVQWKARDTTCVGAQHRLPCITQAASAPLMFLPPSWLWLGTQCQVAFCPYKETVSSFH